MNVSLLTPSQLTFTARLAKKTGLNVGVVAAWVLSEESGAAAQSREKSNNNDWLNIGYTGTATYGASDKIWSDPTTAADATAQWLAGQNSIPNYGTASTGVQNILKSAGQSWQQQVQAIQHSGWAASGYPQLTSVVNQIGADKPTSSALADAYGQIAVQGGAIQDAVSNVADTATSVANFLGKLTNPKLWLRALEVIGGVILLGMGLMSLSGRTVTPVSAAKGAAGAAVKVVR